MRKKLNPKRAVSLPSPSAARKEFNLSRKALGSTWKKWSMQQCIEVSLALSDHLKFREVLLSRANQTHRRFVSVSAAARILKMHRASVHRYLQGKPHLRNSRGKVILGRLIDEMAQAGCALETRGRRTPMRPRRPRLNNLPEHLAPFRSALSEFWAWRRALGQAWLRLSAQECLDDAEILSPAAEFVEQLNQRALRLMQGQMAA
jgi:hypothetical protein